MSDEDPGHRPDNPSRPDSPAPPHSPSPATEEIRHLNTPVAGETPVEPAHTSAVAGQPAANATGQTLPPPPPGWAYVPIGAGADQPPPPPPPGLAYVQAGPPGGPGRPGGRWRGRRAPLLAVAALLIGCVLGAGITAVGAVLAGHHGDHHSRSGPGRGDYRFGGERGDRGQNGDRGGRGGPGRGDGRTSDGRTAPGNPPATAPSTATPAPSASS
jgi:hypothetical protein